MSLASGPTSASLPPILRTLGRHRGLIFPVACIGLIAVLLVPLPPVVIDLLLVVNLTVSVLLFATAMYVRSPLELAVLPSLLLAVTMFRLALNVATTRLILTAGAGNVPPQQALDDAGKVVQAFASFVTSGSMAVGVIIFAIIFVIQFVVITRGATRISEVTARFTLDAMPGRQMAIDADLGAGIIDQEQAHARREEITQQADFYGAMDGASKFIRGDAVAGILITFVNICGGMYVGLVERRWELAATADLFSKLTIGDGLVAQVPAFITALGCGLLITRSSARADLGEQVATQLFSSARPLWIAAAFLLCLSLTGLPALPLMVLAVSCAALAFGLGRKARSTEEAAPAAQQVMAVEQPPTPLEDLLEVQVLELQLGCGVARLADESCGGDLMERLSQLRRHVALELGLIVPAVRVCDNPQLPASQYVLKIRGAVVACGEAYQDQQLATDAGQALPAIAHADSTPDPATGRPSYWITDSQAAEARRLGYALSSAAEAVTSHLQVAIREQAHLLLNREEVRRLVDHLKRTSPALVEEVIGPQIRLGELQKVLQNLLRRGIGIRDLEIILERLGDHAGGPVDIDHLTEHCARALTCHHSLPGIDSAPGQSIFLARR